MEFCKLRTCKGASTLNFDHWYVVQKIRVTDVISCHFCAGPKYSYYLVDFVQVIVSHVPYINDHFYLFKTTTCKINVQSQGTIRVKQIRF